MGTLQAQPAEAAVFDRFVDERVLPGMGTGISLGDGTRSAAGASASDTITAMVDEYSTTLYRVAYSITRNAAEAEDAVQEAFLRVLRNQEKLGEIRDVRIWLIRITWNLVLDRKRRTKVRPETEDVADLARTLADVQPTADETLASAQSCQRILDLIDRLPSKERQALLLSAIEELSTVEIAAVIGTTESSVRSRIFRARRELSLLLERERIVR
jgi:RNA polymerase sigma-70 factor, ECF subfamily